VTARRQHGDYCALLSDAGIELEWLPVAHDLPDAVFVEDTAVVLHEVAVITRPGAETRRPETAASATALARWRDLVTLESPATLDGGDVLVINRTVYVGETPRSNAAGRLQLAAAVAPFGYRVERVPVKGCLHLKSAVTRIGPDRLLANPRWVDIEAFGSLAHLPVAPDEPHAANSVLLPDGVLVAAEFPRTRERLEAAGVRTVAVSASELAKAEGALTCQSIIFSTGSAR
jgi:dimethylargininase